MDVNLINKKNKHGLFYSVFIAYLESASIMGIIEFIKQNYICIA